MRLTYYTKVHIPELIASVLIFLFVYAASSKLLAWHSFASVLRQSPLIGNYAVLIAWVIPITEIAVGALLLFSTTRLTGLYNALALLTAFTMYIAYMVGFSSHLPCSCGGVLSQLTWKQHLVFNFFFMIISVKGIILEKYRRNESVPSNSLNANMI